MKGDPSHKAEPSSKGIDLGQGADNKPSQGDVGPSGERRPSTGGSSWSLVGLSDEDDPGKAANPKTGQAAARKEGQVPRDAERIKLSVVDPGTKAGEQKPAEKAPLTMSGEVKQEIAKLPANFFKQTAASIFTIKANLAQQGAEVDGKIKVSGSDKPQVVKTEIKTTTGSVTQETASGFYSADYAGKLAYADKAQRAAGILVAAGYEGGWSSKTIIREDRFGALVTVTEAWADATFQVDTRAGADANAAGAQMNVKITTQVTADKGIKISTTDAATGITYTKSGVLRAEASAGAEAKAMITWERVSVKLGARVGASASATGGFQAIDRDGTGVGIGLSAAANAEAQAKLGADASWNPMDGYTAKIKQGIEVDFGIALGLEPKLATVVSELTVGADACFGKIGAHADFDIGYKDGIFKLSLDIGGALGIGGNLKFSHELDVVKYAKNATYWYGATASGAQFAHTGQFNPVVSILNPSDLPAAGILAFFGNAPEEQEEVVPLDHWQPTGAEFDATTKAIIYGGAPVNDKSDVMKLFGEMVYKLARQPNLKQVIDNFGSGNSQFAKLIKDNNRFMDRDPTDLNSFTFTPGKNPVYDISDRCEKWFPGSADPAIKAIELSFKGLPLGFEEAFRFKNSDGNQTPDPQSAFAMFSGLSLVQYLSIKAYEPILAMDEQELDAYLKSPQTAHLEDEAKVKLAKLWDDARKHGRLPDPYRKTRSIIRLNSYGANVLDMAIDSEFWKLARSEANGKDKKAQFDSLVAEFNGKFFKMPKSPVADHTLGPVNGFGQHLIDFKCVPFSEDMWRLIDLVPAKEGKIGINDLIYQHTERKMDSLGSPQAVFQFLSDAESYWIADNGYSRTVLFQEWWSKNKNGEWSKAEDPDAVAARQWYNEHKKELFSNKPFH